MGVLVAGVVVYLSAPNAPQIIERSVYKFSLDIIIIFIHTGSNGWTMKRMLNT